MFLLSIGQKQFINTAFQLVKLFQLVIVTATLAKQIYNVFIPKMSTRQNYLLILNLCQISKCL